MPATAGRWARTARSWPPLTAARPGRRRTQARRQTSTVCASPMQARLGGGNSWTFNLYGAYCVGRHSRDRRRRCNMDRAVHGPARCRWRRVGQCLVPRRSARLGGGRDDRGAGGRCCQQPHPGHLGRRRDLDGPGLRHDGRASRCVLLERESRLGGGHELQLRLEGKLHYVGRHRRHHERWRDLEAAGPGHDAESLVRGLP